MLFNLTTVVLITGIIYYRNYLGEIRAATLNESEEKLSATPPGIGDAVIATNFMGMVAFMNPVAERLTGLSAEEAAGVAISKVFHNVNEKTETEVENPMVMALREDYIAGLANHTVLIAKDGTRTPIDDSGAPITDGQGNVDGTVLVFRDIAERKQVEKSLRESENRLEAFFGASPDALTIFESGMNIIMATRVEQFGMAGKK